MSVPPPPPSGPTPVQRPLPLDHPPAAGAPALQQALLRRALPAEPGVYDELRLSDAALRPAWEAFCHWAPGTGAQAWGHAPGTGAQAWGQSPGTGAQASGQAPAAGVNASAGVAAALDQLQAQVAFRLRHDGVTHNVFSERGVASRPWSLELLPLLIDAADWAGIERGIAQRAALLQRLLADLYGPQTVLERGLLPPALLLRHPGYLRPLRGVRPPGDQRLYIVAFDLARDADGLWWVMAQRTQVPSGLGYVMHNRRVIAGQFPEAFRELRVQHLASGFRRLLDTLEARARALAGGATPRLVFLTPGRYSETYFEHAYLARYLGLPLVEGSDLAVLGEDLYLKTVEGLRPVHGVMRRLDDDYCDPLELRPDSALGVPGLLQVARAGRVVLANALGSAVLESPALLGFLPGIAQHLTGEALLLPSVPTWWCGEPAAWNDVQPHVGQTVLRSTFPEGGRTSKVHPFDRAQVERDPDAWTLQAHVRLSRAPIWGLGMVQPRPAVVRVYAVADLEGRWHVLPGGMTRVAPREDASLSMQRGGTSLDTWVLTDGPVDSYSMLPRPLTVADIEQRVGSVTSRTGENLFWMGRYTERAEQQVRAARVLLQFLATDHRQEQAALAALSALAADLGLVPPGVPTLGQSENVFVRTLLASLGDEAGRSSASLAYTLAALERTAQALRERLSTEQWSLMQQLRDDAVGRLSGPPGGAPEPVQMMQVLPALDRAALQLAAATGAQSDRMTRDHGWRLLTVGRLLERLMGQCQALLRLCEGEATATAAGVEILLDLFDSAITFRSRYQRQDDLLALADVLLIDSTNPRALAGVLRRLRTELRKLPGDEAWHQALVSRLPGEGSGTRLQDLEGLPGHAARDLLAARARALLHTAWGLADDIGHRYFTLPGGADAAQRV